MSRYVWPTKKFLRLLQLLGEHVEGTKKVIVFLDTQARTDNLFEQLLRSGYSSLSLHGGKDQEDRDSTISDFKRKDGPQGGCNDDFVINFDRTAQGPGGQ